MSFHFPCAGSYEGHAAVDSEPGSTIYAFGAPVYIAIPDAIFNIFWIYMFGF